jgi:hypothetical protein
MREWAHRWVDSLPLQFRVLYRQFLLRVVDLEALSIQADIPRYLGQFAGVLIMLSAIRALGFLMAAGGAGMTAAARLSLAWETEQNLIATMMLVAGLVAVLMCDATFPDRRDAMVLGPLPVAPRMILLAKVAASGAVLGLAVLALNFATGLALPLVLGGIRGFVRCFAAYWFVMAAATIFLYGAVLAAQGLGALIFPRRVFLRLSTMLQLAAFGVFLGVFFFQPLIATPAGMAAPENHRMLMWLPPFWFFALFNELNGTLPADLGWLAMRAWVGVGVVVCGAGASLLACYLRTMKKMVEEPDLLPGARSRKRALRFGGLRGAVVLFSMRSLARSRHHRVACAFYLALAFAVALAGMRGDLAAGAARPLDRSFLIATLVMMCLVVVGLRSVFSLPITLNANWVLRVTQLDPPERYIDATRWTLVLLGIVPVWLCAALLSLSFRPWYACAAHLLVLALMGSILTELSMIGVSKIPFACSYLPGKSNFQYTFWGFLILFTTLAGLFGEYEERALREPVQYAWMVGVLAAVVAGLWIFNRHRAKSAALYFEETEPEIITTLGLAGGAVSSGDHGERPAIISS